MKSLYTRVVITFILISFLSSFIALFASNLYYQNKLVQKNEQKIVDIGKEMRTLYNKTPDLDLDVYLHHVANMGFQIYLVNDQLQGSFYGGMFKDTTIEEEQVKRVLHGSIYRGIAANKGIFIISFFENSIHNSIGIPIEVTGEPYALFVRPDLQQQIGEIRIYMALLLIFTFLSSAILIVILSRYIVKPIKHLTKATNQIMKGNYAVELSVLRRDEIGELSKHFTQMATSIKQLDEMRQAFVANVSHEIQSPLTSIQGFTQTMIDQQLEQAEVKHYLMIINEESRRLSSLSKQLLTLASLEKENNVWKMNQYSLDEQIREVLIATEWQWAEKQLTMDVDLVEVVITADRQLLYQVWFNLLTNSIKFSHTGGRIKVSMVITNDIAVEIADDGIGIAAEEVTHIFDRFYKVDKSRGTARSGSGLGLSIVKQIVKLHNGTIEVESELGKGTIFRIKLPY